MARGVWQSAVTVRAKETDHPAWHWLNTRNLWRPEFPLTSCLRWLPASAHWPGRGQHTGAGSIVALAALPLPLRLFVESVLAVSQQDRRSGKPQT